MRLGDLLRDIEAEPQALLACARALGAAKRRLRIEKVDGEPALDSPHAALFADCR